MRILYISNAPIIGGAEISLLSHLRYIDKHNFKVFLLCSAILAEEAKNIDGVEVIPMNFFILHRFSPMTIVNFLRMVFHTIKVVRQKHIDIIHSNSVKAHYIATVTKILTGRKLVWWMRDNTINRFIYRMTSWIPNEIVFISEYLQGQFGQRKNGIIIYNGTDVYKNIISESEKDSLRETFGCKGEVTILCSERLVIWKGVQVLIEALHLIQDLDFVALILGTGKNQRDDNEFELIKKTSEYGLTDKVKFLGWRSDRNKFLQIADIFVHPVIEPEPFGLVVIEAMSFALPVIVSDIGGPKEIIDSADEGFLIKPNDPYVLAEKLRDLIASRAMRKQVGEAAREHAINTFTQELETISLENVYNAI